MILTREDATPKGLDWPLRNEKKERREDFMGWLIVEGICRCRSLTTEGYRSRGRRWQEASSRKMFKRQYFFFYLVISELNLK